MRRDPPTVLVTATTWWPSVAVLASALEQAGCSVVMLCPKGHAAFAAQRFRCLRLDRLRPLRSLARAIRAVGPDLVVPGDDRAMAHLLAVGAGRNGVVQAVVRRSVGAPHGRSALVSRVALLEAAVRAGFTVPPFGALGSTANLGAGLDRLPPPWVLKADGAWGGEGVRIAHTCSEARHAFRTLSRGLPWPMACKRAVLNGDPFWLLDRRRRKRCTVSVQGFVDGRSGNCALFALDGVVHGMTIVETERVSVAHGPSTLVRAVERPAVATAARRLVEQLGLSGFLGLDFIVEHGTDQPVLIEMNPRLTAPARMRGPFGIDPVHAAVRALSGDAGGREAPARERFAVFPLAWLADPAAPDLDGFQADVPWHEPGLVEEALRPPWPERGWLASMPARWRAHRRPAVTAGDGPHAPFGSGSVGLPRPAREARCAQATR